MGWEWIFYANVPVGVIGFILAARFVPPLTTTARKLDAVGVVLSGLGLLLVVFAVQEGSTYDWGTITGPITIWLVIAVGVIVLAAFVAWEARQGEDALMPLRLFRSRSFALANIAITAIGFAITTFALPIILWAQDVRGFSTIQSALLLLPMAVVTVALSPIFGQKLGHWSPCIVATGGVMCFIGGLIWYAWTVGHDAPWPATIAPSALIGIANASMWGALPVTATRDLPTSQAGAAPGSTTSHGNSEPSSDPLPSPRPSTPESPRTSPRTRPAEERGRQAFCQYSCMDRSPKRWGKR